MRWLPRLRLAFARRPWLYWALAGALATVAAWQVSALHTEARRARDSWGRTASVWVATADAASGAPLQAERRRYPTAVLPRATYESALPPAVAARQVNAGAVLVAADVADDDTVPTTWVVFAVPVDDVPALAQGDGVAVFAGGGRLCDGTVAASPAAVVEFAVPPECAAAVATAVPLGDVVLARRA